MFVFKITPSLHVFLSNIFITNTLFVKKPVRLPWQGRLGINKSETYEVQLTALTTKT